jgi:ABC-type nitrate/sulfonate/bicarbonate transport system substrate-binding protein
MGREASEGRCRCAGQGDSLDPGVLDLAVSRFSYGAKPVSPEVLAEQQRIADVFQTLKLIPKPIRVADAARQAPPRNRRSADSH